MLIIRFISIILILCFMINAQTTRTIDTEFEIEQGAANRIIANEYNPEDFHFSGTISGHTYDLQLDQPVVEFRNNFMVMIVTLTATGDGQQYQWTISPAIYVNYDISLSDIIALLDDFDDYVNTVLTNAPSWLRERIIYHYQNLQLTMYPGKVLEVANQSVPEWVSVEITDVHCSAESENEKLIIGLGIDVVGTPANFIVKTYNRNKLRIISNVGIEVKKVQIWSGGAEELWVNNSAINIQKNGNYTYNIDIGTAAYVDGGRKIRIYFESPYNHYVRIYEAVYFYSNDNFWRTRGLFSSIN